MSVPDNVYFNVYCWVNIDNFLVLIKGKTLSIMLFFVDVW